jgi:hypothetical protein
MRSMAKLDTKARQDQMIRNVMLACGSVAVPTVMVGTQSWGWPIHQALVAAALLLPVVAYILMRLWFRHPS